MFRFNFQIENVMGENSDSVENADEVLSEQPCEEISFSDVNIDCVFESLLVGDTKFFLRDLQKINKSENEHFMVTFKDCDVIPTVYEGGLKVWECTYDLLQFLMKNKLTFEGKVVLDLGCGSGLLGIFAALNGAKTVHFQDFNADVLRNFTIPNVQRNNIKSKTKFISGDWKHFSNSAATVDVSYDYILSSEILYSINNYEKLYRLLIQKLRANGEIFIASKSYYFGVGGSVKQFQEFLNKTGIFKLKTVWKTAEGVQREILSVKPIFRHASRKRMHSEMIRTCTHKYVPIMNGKWLTERILNGPFCRYETKEMALQRVAPGYVLATNSPQQQQQHRAQQCENVNKSETTKDGDNLTLKQFLEKYSLPRIVTIVPEEPIAATESSDPATLLNGTLLLYKKYRSGKIEAKKFCDFRNAKLTETNERDVASTVVIPDTYQGWFSVMTERGQVKARQYTTVQRLITAQVTAFLIIGPDVIGYYQNHNKTADGARSRYQYIKTVVRSGQILKLLAVYEDIAEQSTRSKRLSWPLLGSKQQSTQYAECMTIKKQIVYIPITTHGYFYAVSTANNSAEDNVSKVYQIAKLLQVFPLPVRVCSIYPQKINGSILLENYHKEDVMLACVLEEKQNAGNKFRFLEIDVNSKFYVNLVADEHRLFKKARVQKALRNCHVDSDKWCQQLKVIHHIYPSKSQYENNENKPMKRSRKISLGDKKTVKSASFRYSTSYGGAEDVKPLYRNPPAEVYHSKSTSHVPPLYLNIAHKPNEENCSSLPTQKFDRSSVFENEILQTVLARNQNVNAPSRQPSKDGPQFMKKNADSSYHKLCERNLLVTSNEDKIRRVTKNNNNLKARDVVGVEKAPAKFNDLKYRVIKKENTYVERDPSLLKGSAQTQPVYKTQVMVKIDDSYSDAADAILPSSRFSTRDNIYAEIKEYQHQPAQQAKTNNYVIFPQKTSCFVNDNCSSGYIRVPTTSTVNVS